uniref:Uncharacterized protein n=1 Tax=Anopheles merus TaxID=30066 RepID=A0A182UP72_ANOME
MKTVSVPAVKVIPTTSHREGGKDRNGVCQNGSRRGFGTRTEIIDMPIIWLKYLATPISSQWASMPNAFRSSTSRSNRARAGHVFEHIPTTDSHSICGWATWPYSIRSTMIATVRSCARREISPSSHSRNVVSSVSMSGW